uniref:Uncharacterized LOC103037443 n=2 Tax=Astyanax mexicanus TaxID=7994 RepID=A0A3B1JG81_ASTMX
MEQSGLEYLCLFFRLGGRMLMCDWLFLGRMDTLVLVLSSFLLWASDCSSVPFIISDPEAPEGCLNLDSDAPASPVLESLECRSDYTTHIRCSWIESSGSPLSLFHLDPEFKSEFPCVRGPLLVQNSSTQKLRAQCRYNSSMFGIGFTDVFFFQTPHSPGITKSINLIKHTVRRFPNDLDLNIIDRVEQTHPPLQPEPSSLEYDGSGWSPLLVRNSDTDSLPGPFNLQCVYDGVREVRCSWEMMRELTQFILYSLRYRTRPDTHSGWCCGRVEEEGGNDDDAVVKFSCSFSVFKAEVLLLDLRPEPRTRDFQSNKHIEPDAPEGLSVELIRDEWVLNWTIPEYHTVSISSELRYWSSHSPEEVETVLLPPRVSEFKMAESSLLSSTHYLAQVRCAAVPGGRYAGYPSDWTEPVHWTTSPSPGSGGHRVYFYLAVSVSVTVILTYLIILAFHRKVKVWEVSLPSPLQSKALKAVCQIHGERLPSYTEVEDPYMSEVCVLKDVKHLSLHEFDCEYEDTTASSAAESPSSRLLKSQEGCCETGLGLMIEEVQVLLCNIRLDDLQPCSDQQNPVSSAGTTQDALLEVCQEGVEMHDGYLDCPK